MLTKKIIFLKVCVCILFCACNTDDGILENCTSAIDPPVVCSFSVEDFSEMAVNSDSLFNFNTCPLGFQVIYPAKYNYSNPVYNPANSDEIAFIRRNNNNITYCQSELCTFNFCTGELNVVNDFACDETIDWSRSNWIAFHGSGQQIYKIKANGDSLNQITFSGTNFNPSWSTTGDSIVFQESKLSGPHFILGDKNGNHIDTFPLLWRTDHPKLSSKNWISYIGDNEDVDYGLAYMNLETRDWEIIDEIDLLQDGTLLITDTDWSKDNENIIWTAFLYINITNIQSGIRTNISEGGIHRVYRSLAVSPDGDEMIIERQDRSKASLCEMAVLSPLYIMNVDGTNKRKIIFPE